MLILLYDCCCCSDLKRLGSQPRTGVYVPLVEERVVSRKPVKAVYVGQEPLKLKATAKHQDRNGKFRVKGRAVFNGKVSASDVNVSVLTYSE